MIRKILLSSAMLALAGSTAFAAPPAGVSLSKDLSRTTITFAPGHAPKVVPGLKVPGGGAFSNIATKYPNGLYFANSGWTISGPSSAIGEQIWTGVGFTPASNTSAKGITAGVGYVSGNNSIAISLWSDAGGVPGVELAGGDATSLPAFGTCCTTVSVSFKKTALTGGTPYWVVVGTDANSSNTWAAFNDETTNQLDQGPFAQNQAGTWYDFGDYNVGAASVK